MRACVRGVCACVRACVRAGAGRGGAGRGGAGGQAGRGGAGWHRPTDEASDQSLEHDASQPLSLPPCTYLCVCVLCARVHACACMRAFVNVCVRACVRVCV